MTKLVEFILSTEGIEATQHDIVKPFGSGHSALSVRVGDEWIYVDPYIGVLFTENDRIISLERVIELYGRWSTLRDYIERIDAYVQSDFSLSLENAKSLLESICKEICTSKNIEVEAESA